MSRKTLFSSEAVCMGHPDKVADQISDAVLDDLLAQDKYSRVACEVMVKTGLVFVAGEITTRGYCEVPVIVKKVVREIGYTDPQSAFNCFSVGVLTCIDPQSPDIAMGVDEDKTRGKELGAGDQGLMFGYACDETPELMPLAITVARKMVNRAAELRQDGTLPYLRPDGKGQITVEYEDGKPRRISTVVLSLQHAANTEVKDFKNELIEKVIRPVAPQGLLDARTEFLINPTGKFVAGGPQADCGLTGRKIIVDTYGGAAPHGGGAFSGKDPTKVDRSGTYMARYAAKNIVAAGLATRCEIQVAYAIGRAEPVSIAVDTFGTARADEEKIAKALPDYFDFRPGRIIENLDLRRPIYKMTARYGHIGVDALNLSWEKTDKAEALRKALLGGSPVRAPAKVR